MPTFKFTPLPEQRIVFTSQNSLPVVSTTVTPPPINALGPVQGPRGEEVQLQASGTHIQWKFTSAGTWTDLVAIADLAGADGTNGTNGADGTNGIDGKEVELQTTATHVQWRYVGGAWANLVALADLKGADGTNGTDGTNGVDGTTPVKGVDYFDGADGTNVELQKTATHVQWRLIGGTWADLIALSEISGSDGTNGTNGVDGTNIELQKTATHIQWRLVGGTWANLVALADLKGDKGDPGTNGTDGAGLPIGGTTDQILTKVSATDYDYAWETPIAGVTDHGLLTGLADDDHTQYHNTTRANTWLGTKSTTDLSEGTNLYYTETRVTNNSSVAANTAKVTNATHTGDVTGATALTIANDVVSNAKLSNMATSTIKGRNTAGTGDPEDLTATQVRTITSTETTTQLNTRDTNNRNTDNHANGTTNKVFTATEQTKLIGIATGATANQTDAHLLARGNHTGTQTAATISDFQANVSSNTNVSANTAKRTYPSADETKLAGIATGATANDTDANLKNRANHTGTQTMSTISDAGDWATSSKTVPTGDVVGTSDTQTLSNKTITEEAWQTPTLTNGWENYGGSFTTAGYFKDSSGIVYLKGLVRNGTSNSQIFSLPAGYRPSGTMILATVSNSSLGQIRIYADRGVDMNGGSTSWISLDNISFRAA